MAYNQALAELVRNALEGAPELVETKMFGGVGFMVQGNMACGVHEDGLIVRVGPEAYPRSVMEPHTRPFDLTGRPMKGWVVVVPEGYRSEDDLRAWVEEGLNFALTLPPKQSSVKAGVTADAGWHLVLDYQHADETTIQLLGKASGKAPVVGIRGEAGCVEDLEGVHEIIVRDDDARDHVAL